MSRVEGRFDGTISTSSLAEGRMQNWKTVLSVELDFPFYELSQSLKEAFKMTTND